jgi:hypothetical protein
MGVDAIVLGLAAVNEFHVESVSQDEGKVLLLTEVGEPVPAEHTFHANDNVLFEEIDGLEKDLGIAGQVTALDDVALVIKESAGTGLHPLY